MDPQNPADAQRVVSAYVTLLGRDQDEHRYPLSRSALPYSKDVIRRSLRTVTLAVIETEQMTQEMSQFLEEAYVALADYVEDDLARLLTEYQAAGQALEREPATGRGKMSSAAWQQLAATSALAGQIASAIAVESSELRLEFQSLQAPTLPS
jgi:hypothetical protein